MDRCPRDRGEDRGFRRAWVLGLFLAGCSLYVDTIVGQGNSSGKPTPCTLGSRRCQGDFLQECQGEGRYEPLRQCAAGQCDVSTGSCLASVTDGSLGDGAGGGNSTPVSAASCAEPGAGRGDCGDEKESCCTSLLVPGGTFNRGNDPEAPATLSSYRLDKYEVTVGRYRKFVDAWVGGWRPSSGAGKHTHLNGGQGLAKRGGGYERGWDPSWSILLPTSKKGTGSWDTALSCEANFETWTDAPASNEKRPINCVAWYEAYAFCIWDGGFLPSEVEWNYAASGGSEQRNYPWSDPASSTIIDERYASYSVDDTAVCMGDGVPGCALTDLTFVGTKVLGYGLWGHADLGGNVGEWNLDSWRDEIAVPCTDCATFGANLDRVLRGGDFGDLDDALRVSSRFHDQPDTRYSYLGFRCARSAP